MAKSFSLKKALKIGAVGLISGVSGAVLASGFQNFDWSAASMGNAHAGSAARADDAATAWTNPAGLVLLNKHQLVGSGTFILGKFNYNHRSATTTLGYPPVAVPLTNLGDLKDDPAVPAVVPALHYSYPHSKNLAFGMSAGIPFGLATDYGKTSVQRYFATRSELLTVDLNPSISFRVNDHLSLGAGASAQYMRADLNKMGDGASVCTAAAVIGILPGGFLCGDHGLDQPGSFGSDFEINNRASDWGFGYNVGAILSFAQATKLGVHFRSSVKHSLKGKSEFKGAAYDELPPITVTFLGFVNQKVSGTITLPEILTVSLFHPINEKWDVLADVAFTRWSRFKNLSLKFEKMLNTDVDPAEVGKTVTTPQNYKNTWRSSVGVNHHCTQNWTVRGGYMYEKSPVQDAFRTARLPDKGRQWGTVGVQYLTDNKKFAFDASYAHVFFKRNIALNETDPGHPTNTLSGKYNGKADLFGAQVTWNID